MKRSELINTICWSCWWREGSHCFSDDFGKIPKEGITILGHDITIEHITKCKNSYTNKRSMLSLIPNDKLIILSENERKEQ